MTIKHWDDQELAKVSADLDAELEQLFDEMETVLSSAVEGGPTLEFLPDDDEEPEATKPQRPGHTASEQRDCSEEKISPDDFEDKLAAVAPAKDREEIQLPINFRPRAEPEKIKEQDLPEAEILQSDDEDIPSPDLPKQSVADLAPEDFARLMEKSVARGVLAALKKWQKPLKD